MASDAYLKLLRDPRWQRKRLEIMQRDGWECTNCGANDKTLNVHHRRYVNGRKPWEYGYDELATLCEACHERETELKRKLSDLMAQVPMLSAEGEQILGYVSALVAQEKGHDTEDVKLTIESYEFAEGVADAMKMGFYPVCEDQGKPADWIVEHLDENKQINLSDIFVSQGQEYMRK